MKNDGMGRAEEGKTASDLARRIAAGDVAAEHDLVVRYSRALTVQLLRLTGSPELVQDLRQETFRIVLERLRRRRLDDPAALAGFLRGTARNLVLAERRRIARQRTTANEAALARAVDPASGQLTAMLLAEQAATVRELIRELSTNRDRQLLLRLYVADEEKESIRVALGLDRLHFNRVVFRARQRFKELFQRRRAYALTNP